MAAFCVATGVDSSGDGCDLHLSHACAPSIKMVMVSGRPSLEQFLDNAFVKQHSRWLCCSGVMEHLRLCEISARISPAT